MATDLEKLKVSLTKHGANKVALLLQHYDKDEILNHLSGDYMSIHIDKAQTRNILSIVEGYPAPDLWNEIKNYGLEDIFDLVFIAIVFSHSDLIEAFKKGISRRMFDSVIKFFNDMCKICKSFILNSSINFICQNLLVNF